MSAGAVGLLRGGGGCDVHARLSCPMIGNLIFAGAVGLPGGGGADVRGAPRPAGAEHRWLHRPGDGLSIYLYGWFYP